MQVQQQKEQGIRQWLIQYMASALDINSEEIDVHLAFKDYGLDSSASVILTGDLGEWLECDLKPTLLHDFQNIDLLAKHLASTNKLEESML